MPDFKVPLLQFCLAVQQAESSSFLIILLWSKYIEALEALSDQIGFQISMSHDAGYMLMLRSLCCMRSMSGKPRDANDTIGKKKDLPGRALEG